MHIFACCLRMLSCFNCTDLPDLNAASDFFTVVLMKGIGPDTSDFFTVVLMKGIGPDTYGISRLNKMADGSDNVGW